jgi:FO synthase
VLLETAAAVRAPLKAVRLAFPRGSLFHSPTLPRLLRLLHFSRRPTSRYAKPYMLPDEVLAVADAGRRAGCKEALFSLGDQPERVFPEASRSWALSARSNTWRR